MKMEDNVLGQKIRNRREELGLTLDEVSRKIGVAESTMHRYETGEIRSLKYETLVKLAEVLRVYPMYFFGFDEKKPGTISDDGFISEFEALYVGLTPEKRDIIKATMKAMQKD